MKYFVSLDRITLLYASYLLIRDREVYLIPSEPFTGFYARLFGWLRSWVECHPCSNDAITTYPDFQKYWKIPGYSSLTDAFSKTEHEINRYFNFDETTVRRGDPKLDAREWC